MKNSFVCFMCMCFLCVGQSPWAQDIMDSKSRLSPDERFGQLFVDVQRSTLFSDSKTFVDSVPKYSTDKILADYERQKNAHDFDLKAFVLQHFILPANQSAEYKTDSSKNAKEHINDLWDVLTRKPEVADNGSLITIPYAYVVPGGRFREVYYWDSYFTMLGLQASGRWDLIENMINNFSYLIDTVGFIPNANRTYYLTRSQPPFYSLMLKLLEEKNGTAVLVKYKNQLQKEYEFWMNGADKVSAESPAFRRVVRLPDGALLNRYWDDATTPRPESYAEDILLNHQSQADEKKFRDIRAAAESGWDFSSRWFKDDHSMETIHTTDIIPLDLNALLFHLEEVLTQAFKESGDQLQSDHYAQLAQARKKALLKYCWNDADGFLHDYDFVVKKQTNNKSLAAMYPLFFNMVDAHQAQRIAAHIEHDFLKPGGVTTTLNKTKQQWDAPNGWAPLQWITIKGLSNYHYTELAKSIQTRWIDLTIHVYKNTGKFVEKYNVYEVGLKGGGGEYPVQDGFGWTNGVLLKLLEETNTRELNKTSQVNLQTESEHVVVK